MSLQRKIRVVYVTKSDFKKEEIEVFLESYTLDDGTPARERFTFEIHAVDIKEQLEVDIAAMVRAEVVQAYSILKIPCIVEHAGLILEDYVTQSYPGGLTKAMWNALGENFVKETGFAGRRAIARAVIGYCDGKGISTFTGETLGTIADAPRGTVHEFYWDTVFMPDDPTGKIQDMTYSEIVQKQDLGLKYKMSVLSQSAKAMKLFLEHLLQVGPPELWGKFV